MTESRDRVWIDKQHPAVFRALSAVAAEVRAAATAAGIDRRLIELINLRVSQINGCPYCLAVHERAALGAGLSAQEITVLPAWRRGGAYSAADRAALGLAEAVTTLPAEENTDREYEIAREYWSEEQISVIVWIAVTIGAFNRVSILSAHPVPVRKERKKMSETTPAQPASTEPERRVARNEAQNRYDVFLDGEPAGFAEYVERGNDTDFVHTEIDGAFAGKGLGGVLAKQAIEDVIARGRTITAHCPFIRGYLDKHPEYDAHVVGKGIPRE
ncbi:N-acetyltransferase [Nocardia sp. NPDC058633]|uniref:N-acetyltransferase n=1 Tax=Nocardia sp. NPDC058633 TaxID=3346568 RepID=UPI003664D97D